MSWRADWGDVSGQVVLLLPSNDSYFMKKGSVRNSWINIVFEDCQARCQQDENLDSQEQGKISQGSARTQLAEQLRVVWKMTPSGKKPGIVDNEMAFLGPSPY